MRARVGVLALLLLLLAGAGCTPITRAFHCTADGACVDNEARSGICQANGWCSFPALASECASGQRYGIFAGGGLANQCVTALDSCGALGERCCADAAMSACQPKLQCIGGGCVGCVAGLALGDGHGCALVRDGSVACWGKNDHGQLGNGTTGDAAAAVPVVDDHGLALGGVTAVVTGAAHSCALKSDGTLRCWGDNSSGQLGGGGAQSMVNATPALVPLTSIVAVAAGARHACAALSAGAVWCWGANEAGQLGVAAPASAPMPVEVVDKAGQPIDAVALAAGATHTCAVRRDQSLWCWGSNLSGELGDGSSATTSPPVAVSSLGRHVVAVAAGAHFGCALGDDGKVRCFGQNDRGQAGQPAGAPAVVPMAVPGIDGVTALAAGGTHACARRGGGQLSCWGDGSGSPSPVQDGVGAIGVGANDRCSARSDGIACSVFGDPHLACP